MQTVLVEITDHEDGWKGTWYKTGQKHFARQHPRWPKVMACRWKDKKIYRTGVAVSK